MAGQLPPGCRGTVLVSARSGAIDRNFPDLAVSAAVADGRGGWFVTAGGLLRLDPRGRIERRWRSGEVRGTLQHLVRVGPRLYATDGRRVFAFDAASGRRLWSSGIAGGVWWNDVRPTIYTLRADGVAVYAGGSFTRFAGAPRAAVAALDAGTGELRDWRPRIPVKPRAEPTTVVALGLGSGHLYAASASFTDGPARVGERADDAAVTGVRLLQGGSSTPSSSRTGSSSRAGTTADLLSRPAPAMRCRG
jgi:outer membrane protein assembly factor BamB